MDWKQLWDITVLPDNIPIVILGIVTPFYLWYGFREAVRNDRLIAKLASEAGKPDGLTVIRPDEVLAFLAPMPVGNLRGVGRRTRKIFERLGIRK